MVQNAINHSYGYIVQFGGLRRTEIGIVFSVRGKVCTIVYVKRVSTPLAYRHRARSPVIALISENDGVAAIAREEYTMYVVITRITDQAGKSSAHSLKARSGDHEGEHYGRKNTGLGTSLFQPTGCTSLEPKPIKHRDRIR